MIQINTRTLSQLLDLKFKAVKLGGSTRTVFLTDLQSDLQFGVNFHTWKKRGLEGVELAIGLRVPSIEDVLADYEVDFRRRASFSDLTPVCWMTFWKELETDGLSQSDALSEIKRLYVFLSEGDAIHGQIIKDLLNARMPAWADMPKYAFMAQRVLAARDLHRGSIQQTDIDEAIKLCEVSRAYESNVIKFADWLTGKNENPQGGACSLH